MNNDAPTVPLVRAAIDDRLMLKDLAASMFGDAQRVQVGRFVVVERIGAGGMGVVLKAWDPRLDRAVALKVLASDGPVTRSARDRLQREAIGLARLAHPNVVQIHEVGLEGDEVFLAMELVDGVDLARWAREHPVGSQERLDEARRLLAEAGEGLAAAHRAGLVHRDFKPSNVLVGRDGRARVADFGLAQAVSVPPTEGGSNDTGPAGVTGSIAGTPPYMSPEQHSGGVVDAASDQFSFCVAAWEVLFGERPWDEYPRPEQPPPRPAGAPVWIVDLLLRGLSHDPDDRHPSMRALVDALATDPSRRRRRRLAAVAGLLSVAAIAMLGIRHRLTRCDPPLAVAEAFRGAYTAACEADNEAALGCLALQQTAVQTGATEPEPERCALAPAVYRLPEPQADVLDAYGTILRGEEPPREVEHPVVRSALIELRSRRAPTPEAAFELAHGGYSDALRHGDDAAAARFATRLAELSAARDRNVARELWLDHAALLDPG